MSGGFFRGTSADQDTRFSNKQAKLLKSQKFAPELDNLVDMSKVKMDVIRPWIATRATEFLGFEDEVLINFIYGLLDGKVVDGKHIQIQLTGFMEKNTGKFMKELWSLLLSAQKNVSGVPQQFLDAKEEETRKKKAEADHITHELQRIKEREGRELEQELSRKMDGEMDVSRTANATATLKNSLPTFSEDREVGESLGSEGQNRLSRSPHAVGCSPSPNRSSPSASRSCSKSFSNSRSYSGSPYSSERRKSNSISGSPQPRRQSLSPERQHRSPLHSPRRKHSPRYPWSPSRRRSPHLKRRSPSAVWRRSPSPARYRSRSPVRRRSLSPVWRRSRTPVLRRFPSPYWQRSPSPIHRRSPSPIRRRSPSPYRRRSPSPLRRRSPLTRSPRYRRRSPLRSPRRQVVGSQNSPRHRNRSRSPYGSHSPPYGSRVSLSRERDGRVNGVESRRYRDDHASQRTRTKRSPDRHALEREDFEHLGGGRRGPESVSRQPLISLRSPQRDAMARTRNRVSVFASPSGKTPSQSDSPPLVRKLNPNEDRRKPSASGIPERPTREHAIRHDAPEISGKELEMDRSRKNLTQRDDSLKNGLKHSPTIGNRKKSPAKGTVQYEYSPSDYIKSRKNDPTTRSDSSPRQTGLPRPIQKASRMPEEIEYGPGRPEGEHFSPSAKRVARHPSSSDERFSNEQVSLTISYTRGGRVDEKKRHLLSNVEYRDSGRKSDSRQKSTSRVNQNNQVGPFDSDGEENESCRIQDLDKRKNKRQESSEVEWNNEMGYASPMDDRKEAKRRKREEKRLRKEERRSRREERHRRREERRAGKLKVKTVDTVAPPSNYEKKHSDADDSEDDDVDGRRGAQLSETEETESEQKKLEIELRKKALESLRAKKAISH